MKLKAEQAAKLLAEIDKAEKPGTETAAEDARRKEEQARLAAQRERRRKAEEAFAKALAPIEAKARVWNFAGALAELAKLVGGASPPRGTQAGKPVPPREDVQPQAGKPVPPREDVQPQARKPVPPGEDVQGQAGKPVPPGGFPPDLAERLKTRQEELQRLANLKARFIERINTANPKLDKRALMIPGFNGQLVKADEGGITAKLPTGKTEAHPWDSLSERSVERVLRLVVRKDDPDDCIAAGLLALSSGNAPAAEKHLERAKARGASVVRYLHPLAAAPFKDAKPSPPSAT